MWVGSRKVVDYQSDSHLSLFSKPLSQFSDNELKVLQDALCDSHYEVEVNYKIDLFEEMHEYKPPIVG